MLHAAMRTVAPSFVFGLAFARFTVEEEPGTANGGGSEDPPPSVDAAPEGDHAPASTTT